jgi:hypothetical protein
MLIVNYLNFTSSPTPSPMREGASPFPIGEGFRVRFLYQIKLNITLLALLNYYSHFLKYFEKSNLICSFIRRKKFLFSNNYYNRILFENIAQMIDYIFLYLGFG